MNPTSRQVTVPRTNTKGPTKPVFTFLLIVFTVMSYEDLTYNRTYRYPDWALQVGWCMSISSIICIPVYAIYRFLVVGGTVNQVNYMHTVDHRYELHVSIIKIRSHVISCEIIIF